MIAFDYDPKVHRIHRVPCVSDLERKFPEFDLFVYRHEKTGRWVIAEWRKRWRSIEDLVILGTSFAPSREQWVYLDYLLRGPSVDPMKQIEGWEVDQRNEVIDEFEEEKDATKFVKKRVGDDNPRSQIVMT